MPVGGAEGLMTLRLEGTRTYTHPGSLKKGADCCSFSAYLLVSKGANPQWGYKIYKVYVLFFVTYVAFNLLLPFLFLPNQCCIYSLGRQHISQPFHLAGCLGAMPRFSLPGDE